jgi:hypothetical protein
MFSPAGFSGGVSLQEESPYARPFAIVDCICCIATRWLCHVPPGVDHVPGYAGTAYTESA